MSEAAIATPAGSLQRAVERTAFPLVFAAAVGLHALGMARGWSPEGTVAGATFGAMIVVGVISVLYVWLTRKLMGRIV